MVGRKPTYVASPRLVKKLRERVWRIGRIVPSEAKVKRAEKGPLAKNSFQTPEKKT